MVEKTSSDSSPSIQRNSGKGKLSNKVGAAFTCSDGTSTGAETTALPLVTAMFSHDMVIVSAPGEGPGWLGTYGVAADNLRAIGFPDGKMLGNSKELGERVAEVARKLLS